MAARQVYVGGAMPSRDGNGRALPALLYFYEPDTAYSTPATVYTTSALATAHDFPIESDAAGRFPQIWAEEAETFDVTWNAKVTGAQVRAFEDVSPLNDSVDASVALSEAAQASAEDAADEAAASLAAVTAAIAAAEAGVPAGVLSFAGATGVVTAPQAKTALSLDAVQNLPIAGRHAIWVPAAAMIPRTTNGAAAGLSETTTNKVMRRSLDFDKDTIEYSQFTIKMPKSWDEGTITFVPVWFHGAATAFKVSWGLQGVALSNNEGMDAAFGTAIYSNDTGGTTDRVYFGDESTAITIAGTPAAEDLVVLQALRMATDATNDTLDADGKLLGYALFLTTVTGVDT